MKFGSRISRRIRSHLMVSLATVSFAVTAPSLSAQTSFLIEFADEKLSVKGDSIPVKDLLIEIQYLTGIHVNFISDPKETVTLDIDEQSIEQVIAKISDNHMIIHDTVDGLKTIRELFFISGTTETVSASVSEFLPSGEPAPLVAAVNPVAEDEKATEEKLSLN